MTTEEKKPSGDADRSNAGTEGSRQRTSPRAEGELQRILDDYSSFLRRTVLHHCSPRLGLDPDEIEQLAVLKLWRALERETEVRNPASYLYRIVANVTTDAIRAARRKGEVALEDPKGEPVSSANKASDQPSPLRVAESVDIAIAIAESLEKLHPNRRRAVALHLDGFTNVDISAMLGWSEAKVRNLVWRGANDLRTHLRKAGIEP